MGIRFTLPMVLGERIESCLKFLWLRVMVRSAATINRGFNLHANTTSLSLVAFERSIEPGDSSISRG